MKGGVCFSILRVYLGMCLSSGYNLRRVASVYCSKFRVYLGVCA